MDGAGAPKPVSRCGITADGFRADCGEPRSGAGERVPVVMSAATASSSSRKEQPT